MEATNCGYMNWHGNGTSVELVHTNIPDGEYADFVKGWNSYYFGVLYEFYKEG